MVDKFCGLSGNLKSKFFILEHKRRISIDLSDGLQLKEANVAKLSKSEIQEIQAAGYQVDDEVLLDADSQYDEDIEIDLESVGLKEEDSNDLDKLTAKKQEIDTTINNLKQRIEISQKTIETEEKELEDLNNQYNAEAKILQEKEELFEKKQNQLKKLNEEITETQQQEQRRYENKISDITSEAISTYNPEKHGDDFNTYLDECLSQAGISTYSDLDSLNSSAKALANEANSLLSEIKIQAKSVQNITVEINAKTANINNLKSTINAANAEIEVQSKNAKMISAAINKIAPGAGLTASEVLSLISEDEKCLAKSLGIDLAERKEDGEPRYLIARGQDNRYHIYDSQNIQCASLARLYGNSSFSPRGSDLVPEGSGYIMGTKDAEPGQGRAVYTFSSINEDWTDGETCSSQQCYRTDSPL
ncbi:hypothetical protein IJG14_01255, partial [bacterium]|nr:hypothetical protein [bacterium]